MLEATIIGNIGKDAEVKEFNGSKFVSFNVAHSHSYTNAAGEKVEDTTWVTVTRPWRDGDRLTQYLTKGTQVYVRGTISTRVYQIQNGGWAAGLNMKAFDIQLLGSRQQQAQPAPQQQPVPRSPRSTMPVEDNDLPF